MTTIYRQALDMQAATDLSVVVAHFATAVAEIAQQAQRPKAVNRHAICRLYAEQIAWLTGAGSCPNHRSYLRARAACEKRAKLGE
jgi:hypothetical protein